MVSRSAKEKEQPSLSAYGISSHYDVTSKANLPADASTSSRPSASISIPVPLDEILPTNNPAGVALALPPATHTTLSHCQLSLLHSTISTLPGPPFSETLFSNILIRASRLAPASSRASALVSPVHRQLRHTTGSSPPKSPEGRTSWLRVLLFGLYDNGVMA